VVVVLAQMPLTTSGKINRSALPAAAAGEASSAYVAPSTVAEEVIAGLFASILGVPRVGIEDGFFELGGHSLLAAQLVARINEMFRVELRLGAIFRRPTVSGVVAALAAAYQDERLLED